LIEIRSSVWLLLCIPQRSCRFYMHVHEHHNCCHCYYCYPCPYTAKVKAITNNNYDGRFILLTEDQTTTDAR